MTLSLKVEPKIKGFICTTAHPLGCKASVERQIRFVQSHPSFQGPQRVLVIGASTGYGLASRIALAFGAHASTIGVSFERPASDKRTASAGWYNTVAFEKAAAQSGLKAHSINGDAFSEGIKAQTIQAIQDIMGQVDCVIYSLASPRRTDPQTGEVYQSTLKPIGEVYHSTTIDTQNGELKPVSMDPATEEDIRQTVAVMGGDDWALWIEHLMKAGVLAKGALTMAYSYIGPELTFPIYKNGTIGRAKDHLLATARKLSQTMAPLQGRALISVNKALVTQASSAIPVVPLYISMLYKIMKQKGLHEGCIEQMYRLFAQKLQHFEVDPEGRVRLDDWEMRADVQSEINQRWPTVTAENVLGLIDLVGYRTDFLNLFGFGVEGVDYTPEVQVDLEIPSIPPLVDHCE